MINNILKQFLEIFPITNGEWRALIEEYLYQKPTLVQTLWEHLEPNLNKILPTNGRVFRALNLTNPKEIRIVIVGQDPYPNPKQACGLAFSSEDGKVPASLRNIFREIQADFGGDLRTNADLTDWAKQGVLLINSSLTVLEGQSNCHSKIGWQKIAKFIIETAWEKSPKSIFLLWGNSAQNLVTTNSLQRILKAGHPSPLSYGKKTTNNFKGCGHFKKANQLLVRNGLLPIVWNKTEPLHEFLRE